MAASPVDWAYIICRLQRARVTVDKLAKELEISPRQVHRYKEGYNEPSYSVGSKLIQIYQTVYPST